MVADFNYKKYRWFFTNSGKLVYGGKSAEQNEDILKELMKEKTDFVVMHTRIPGSPFAIIRAPIKKILESDLIETAIWTSCFSRAWRTGLRKTIVDIFTKNQLYKISGMKQGTWGVKGKIERKEVSLKLVLTIQKGVLRAVPFETIELGKDKIITRIIPGKIPKEQFAKIISEKTKKPIEEILNALPTGNFGEVK